MNLRGWIPLGADLLALLLYLTGLPWLVARFQNHSVSNLLLLVAGYTLFCAGVYLLRVSACQHDPAAKNRSPWMVFWSLFFSLMVLYAMLDLSGLLAFLVDTPLDEIDAVMEGVWGTLMTLAVLTGGLAVVALYPLSLLWPLTRFGTADSVSDVAMQAVSLLAINLMILITMAHWEVAFRADEPYRDLALGGKLSKTAVGIFFVQTGYYVWSLLDGSAWL